MKKEYVTFVRSFQGLPEGKELELTVRDLSPGPRKYNARVVKAILSRSPEKMPGDVLWLRSWTGFLHPHPWAIRIVQELGECLDKPPYSDITR